MLKLCSNGSQCLSLLHGFRRLLLYSTSSSTEETHSFANYLVDSLGFSKQQAFSCSAKLTQHLLRQGKKKVSHFDSIPKVDSIIGFFLQNGFDQSQIRKVVWCKPQILRAKIDETLKPKFEFLRGLGLSGSDLVQFFTMNPVVLCTSLNSCILPSIQALREVLGNDENVIATLRRMHYNSFSGTGKYLVPNVALLQNYGIPLESIRRHIIKQPWVYIRKTESFEDILIRVEEKLGIPRDSSMFLYGVRLCLLNEERLYSRCQVFKSFGWNESEFQALLRKNPSCLVLSEARIKKSLGFLMNELGYKPAVITSCPSLLICSLEKRIIPRHRVLLVLKDKGLIRKDYPLYSLASLTEALFVKKFVSPFKEVHEVYTECTGRSVQLLTEGCADTRSQG